MCKPVTIYLSSQTKDCLYKLANDCGLTASQFLAMVIMHRNTVTIAKAYQREQKTAGEADFEARKTAVKAHLSARQNGAKKTNAHRHSSDGELSTDAVSELTVMLQVESGAGVIEVKPETDPSIHPNANLLVLPEVSLVAPSMVAAPVETVASAFDSLPKTVTPPPENVVVVQDDAKQDAISESTVAAPVKTGNSDFDSQPKDENPTQPEAVVGNATDMADTADTEPEKTEDKPVNKDITDESNLNPDEILEPQYL